MLEAKGQPFEMPVSSRNRSNREGLQQRQKVYRIGQLGAGSFSQKFGLRYGFCIGLNVFAIQASPELDMFEALAISALFPLIPAGFTIWVTILLTWVRSESRITKAAESIAHSGG